MPMSAAFARRLDAIVPELAARCGTPFHIYDEAGIRANCRAMAAAFGDWPYRQYFAVKALPNRAILRLMLDAGCGLDCSSPVELRLAEQCGANGDDIVFTSNNTQPAEYAAALAIGADITFDDIRYLERAQMIAEPAVFRVSPAALNGRSTLMGGAAGSKFGIPADRLADAYAMALQRGARRFGLYGMACANERECDHACKTAIALIEIGRRLEAELGIAFESVNFGGGMGIAYRADESDFDFAAYALAIRENLQRAFPGRRVAVRTECGRMVTGPHGVLVTRVLNKLAKHQSVIGVDASMSALLRPSHYPDAWHHISIAGAPDRPAGRIDIVGSMCENGDRFATDRAMPVPEEGDLLYIHDTGAHGHAMGVSYNGRLRPAELLLRENGAVDEIRRAERFDDYVATMAVEPRRIDLGPALAPGSETAT